MPDSPEELLAFVTGLLVEYGYLIVFLGASLDFVLPNTADVFLLAGGWFASGGEAVLWLVMLAAGFGAMVSDNLMYWVGRVGGRPAVTRVLNLGPISRLSLAAQFERVMGFYEKHGGKTVFAGRVLPGLRGAVPLSAGISGMTYPRFLAVDALAVCFWAVVVGSVGFLFGEYWDLLLSGLRSAGTVVLVLLALALFLYLFYRRRGS